MNVEIKSWHAEFWENPDHELGHFKFILTNSRLRNEEYICRVVVFSDTIYSDVHLERGVLYIPDFRKDIGNEIELIFEWLKSLEFESLETMQDFLRYTFHWEYEKNWPFYVRPDEGK